MVAVRKKKSFFRENLSLKLLSLILAVLLELYFYSPDNSMSVTLPASIEVRNIPPGLMVVRPAMFEKNFAARVELRGPKPLIEQARSSVHKFVVEYPATNPMLFTAKVEPRQLWLPAGVEVREVVPKEITIELERVLTKKVSIAVPKVGQLPSGYRIEAISIEPHEVEISGPESELRILESIATVEVDLTSLTAPQKLSLALAKTGMWSILGPATVTVDLKVGVIPAEKSIDKVNISLRSPEGFAGTVEPSRIKINLAGPQASLEKIGPNDIKLVAEAQLLTEGRHELEPSVSFESVGPEDGVTVLSTEPAKVIVNLVKK